MAPAAFAPLARDPFGIGCGAVRFASKSARNVLMTEGPSSYGAKPGIVHQAARRLVPLRKALRSSASATESLHRGSAIAGQGRGAIELGFGRTKMLMAFPEPLIAQIIRSLGWARPIQKR
jgi:hypothetical protein